MKRSNSKNISGINIDVDTSKAGLISLLVTLIEVLRDTLRRQAERMTKKEGILTEEEKERLKVAFANSEKVIGELKEEQDIVESVNETRQRINDLFAQENNVARDHKPQDTLVNALDILLSKGTVIYGGIPLSVAEIVLANINLKATLAGGVTMVEQGLMQNEELHLGRKVESKVPLGKNEEVVSTIFGSYWADKLEHPRWQLGRFYFTNRRVFFFKPELARISLEIPYETIEGCSSKINPEDEKDREELILFLKDKETVRLHSKDTKRLKEMIEGRMKEKHFRFNELSYHFPETSYKG